ncbi:predicted protein [Plenodomus lingam JN3]|uniref:Predicted protein n=2 Tax=Leptosphaeria maculans TaxID=5022 RepID=E4ZTA3_LEPMJ|nr:predicted protein [Plenodomus lingam JN3]CBX90045.1 predicted protein [Plenodomus lingam JN3]
MQPMASPSSLTPTSTPIFVTVTNTGIESLVKRILMTASTSALGVHESEKKGGLVGGQEGVKSGQEENTKEGDGEQELTCNWGDGKAQASKALRERETEVVETSNLNIAAKRAHLPTYRAEASTCAATNTTMPFARPSLDTPTPHLSSSYLLLVVPILVLVAIFFSFIRRSFLEPNRSPLVLKRAPTPTAPPILSNGHGSSAFSRIDCQIGHGIACLPEVTMKETDFRWEMDWASEWDDRRRGRIDITGAKAGSS